MEGEKFDISPKKDLGIVKEIIRVGEGTECPRIGDRVTVHYVGTLEDGTEFDSSRTRDQRFDFNLGRGEVIRAWDIGVATMRKGEIARLTCRPEYAYGESGNPPKIPPNATLIFEIELLEWKGEDLTKDGGVIKYLIKEGEKYSTPNEGATVTIKYKVFHEGVELESCKVTFTQGEGEVEGVIKGLEIATLKMRKAEKAKLRISPKYAYGAEGCPEKNIPPNAELIYEVEMVWFEKSKESWEMNAAEKLEQSKVSKEKGTQFYKKENYALALKNYQRIVKLLEYETSVEGEEKAQREVLLQAAHLNMALCHHKLKSYIEAEHACNKVLEFDAKNVKALFRRGQALMERKEYEQAISDFKKVIELEPENKSAKNHVTMCRHHQKLVFEKEKKIYSKMFQKLADEAEEQELTAEEKRTKAMVAFEEKSGSDKVEDKDVDGKDNKVEDILQNQESGDSVKKNDKLQDDLYIENKNRCEENFNAAEKMEVN